jgi:hypothetical protein
MNTYQVDFAYSVPEWTDITLDAESEEEAKLLAQKEFDDLFPEATDVEIIEVTIIR